MNWDVLVVGGGPAGAATGLLARRARVTGCSWSRRSGSPREKTCGDGLTPRAVRQLETWASARAARDFLRFDGLRSIAHGVTLELAWPEHPDFPDYGYVVRRRDLDEMVADARGEGAAPTLWTGAEAVAPLVEDGLRRRRGGQARRDAGRPSRSGPATWWWPTAPTPASGGRSARRATARTRSAWRSAATSPARSTTSRGSRATSTCATATATTSPATAGSSRWATAR